MSRAGFRKSRRARKWKPNGRKKGDTNRLRRTTARDAERSAKEELRGRASRFSSDEIFELFAEETSYGRARHGVFSAVWNFGDPRATVIRRKGRSPKGPRPSRLQKLRLWVRLNPECVAAARRRWNRLNKDKVNATLRGWRARNPEMVKAQTKDFYARHREERKAAAVKWQRDHRPHRRRYQNERYAAKKGMAVRRQLCGACCRPGHNRRACPAAATTPVAPPSP